MSIILFDGMGHQTLKPLTSTKPVSELRVGILTIKEKWSKIFEKDCGIRTKDYLESLFVPNNEEEELGINAGLLPNEDLLEVIKGLKKNEILMKNGVVLALKPMPSANADMEKILKGSTTVEYDMDVDVIQYPWDVFSFNGQEIENDFVLLTADRASEELHESNVLIGDEDLLFIEEGAEILCATINTTEGPVYIGKNAKILEGSNIKGPFALCDNAVVKMGAKMYQDTTIGPHCKVGGEISNSVLQAYSNKGHDGYLGNSVIGEWCNLGADTNTSNLKNNYGMVKAYSFIEEDSIDTGLQFCGTIMGDHSKTSINTMLNTGTVVGAFSNVFDGGFPPKFVSPFSWGGKEKVVQFKLEKALEVAERMMSRRKIDLSKEHQEVYKHLFEESNKYYS